MRQQDTDELGHVNNVVWLRFIVELSHAHGQAVGVDRALNAEYGAAWVVRRHSIDYVGSALAGESIVESTWVSDVRGARCVRVAEFRRKSDATLLVRAESLWAFVDKRTQRPRRMPPEIAERFDVVEA